MGTQDSTRTRDARDTRPQHWLDRDRRHENRNSSHGTQIRDSEKEVGGDDQGHGACSI
jgi:hypothetical protein